MLFIGGFGPCEAVKRFWDFADAPRVLDGEKLRLDDLINREVTVIGCRISESKFGKNKSGKYLTLQIEIDAVHKVVFTGSDVLIQQMEKYGDEIPFIAVIKKDERFYTLS